jgi:MYXO-CTERM domain-containing protein
MTMSRRIYAYVLAGSMVLGSAGLALAQSTTTNTNAPTTSSARNDTGNRADDRGFDWGWLGLLGLAGLAGLMRKDRSPVRDTRVGGTTTATR